MVISACSSFLDMMSAGDGLKTLFYLQFGWISLCGILWIELFFQILKRKRIFQKGKDAA